MCLGYSKTVLRIVKYTYLDWVGWGGWVCKVIFMSNPTTVEAVLSLTWVFDNFIASPPQDKVD